MALFKKPTEVDKIKMEIDSINFKKNAILAGITNEKTELDRLRTAQLTEMGIHVHAKTLAGDTQFQLAPYMEAIAKLDADMVEKDNKFAEMSQRYAEEVAMLETNVAMLTPAAAPAAMPGGFCDQCGAQVKGVDVFCNSCGNKIAR